MVITVRTFKKCLLKDIPGVEVSYTYKQPFIQKMTKVAK